MRVVADTNIVVSGSLWHGSPRLLLDRAHSGEIQLFTSPALLDELRQVLGRDRFAALAARADVIVSGDNHLQSLKEHRSIPILSANEFLASMEGR